MGLKRSHIVVCIGAMLLCADLPAASPCSIDHAYPEVAALAVEDGRLVATLGRRFVARRTVELGSHALPTFESRHPRLALSADQQWMPAGKTDSSPYFPPASKRASCMGVAVDLQKDWAELYPGKPFPGNQEDFNQLVRHCANDSEFVWGGISFYAAEGSWGIGGLARKNIATGDMDVIRPRGALELSTGPVAHFAGELWIGQYHYGECVGPTSGTGLKKLRFNQYAQRYELESVPEVCGFAIRDFQEFDGALWVATDLGVSRLTPGESAQWTNFVPDLENETLMREVSCDALYAELLSSERFANTEGFDLGFAFEDLWHRLRSRRPHFVRRYLRELHGLPVSIQK